MHFHLDPLWADAEIDFVGIDLYHPLTDWRDEPGHADEASGRSPYDLDLSRREHSRRRGLRLVLCERRGSRRAGPHADHRRRLRQSRGCSASRISRRGGETRTYDRPGGVESGTPTDWVPEGKPIWLTELGCPAIDKGANQPNVFFDPKSSESFAPYFSNAARDDFQQRVYVDAYQRFFDPEHPHFNGSNPVSSVYGERMLDPAHHDALGLGRAALSLFSRSRRRLVRRRRTGSAVIG